MTSAVWVDRASGCTARAGAASHLGHRENNEDLVYLDPDHPFALVLDGMGGQAAGEVASQKGAEIVRGVLRDGLAADADPRGVIERALRAGNKAVQELGRSDEALRNCGTTIVLTLLHRGVAYVSWLGDSPAFRVTADGVEKLTWDHSLPNALLHHGVITAEEARRHPVTNVLWRYLGTRDGDGPIETPSFTPHHGDRLVLATDGVTGILSAEELRDVCRAHPDPQACAEELVSRALDRGSRDNCTCAVIAFERAGEAPPPEPPAKPPPARWWQFWR